MTKKHILLFCFVLLAGVSALTAQSFTIQVKSDCPPEGNIDLLNPDELHADFIGVNVFGEAPLQAKFIDTSTGNPTRWKWQFGDGSSDTLPNAVHVYQMPGVYTVRLTVYAGSDSATIKKINFVRVAVSGGCDSLNYPLPGGEYTLYSLIGIGSGYISGNNSYGTRALASYFDDFEEGGELLAAFFNFGFAERLPTNDVEVYFKVWDANGTSGSPGNVLDSVSVPISSIVQDYEFGRSTMLIFDEPLMLDGPFFMGVELPQVYGDTLALFTNIDGDVELGNGWEQDVDGNWQPYTDTQWGLDIDNAIFPVVCQPVGIENPYLEESLTIFPVPADDLINFVFTDASIKVNAVFLFDMTGRQVKEYPMDGNSFGDVNVSALPEGFYFLRFDTSAGFVNKMIVVGR
jgi:PKD repeat protein